MNLITIIIKKKQKKKKTKKKTKKKEDNREVAYRSEEGGCRDDCGLRVAAFTLSHSLALFGGSFQIPFPYISFSSQDDVVLHHASSSSPNFHGILYIYIYTFHNLINIF